MSTEFDFENYRFYEATTTISGFEVWGSSYIGWEEAYHGNAALVFQKHGITTDFEINTLIDKMIRFDDAGEFLLTQTQTQLPEIAAFCLVLFDRIVCAEKNGYTFEEVFVMHEALQECNGYLLEGDDRKEFARKAAFARHKENRKAKTFVENEWNHHRVAYEGNKSAFTRDYVKRVFNEFNVRITEKQMREVWLKDAPPAS